MMKLLDSDPRKSSTFTVLLYILYIYICIQMITPFFKREEFIFTNIVRSEVMMTLAINGDRTDVNGPKHNGHLWQTPQFTYTL